MLILASPTFVTQNWDNIYKMFKPALFRPSSTLKANLLRGIISNVMQCWLCARDEVGVGMALTNVTIDPFSQTRDLMVYAVVTNGNTVSNDWDDSLDTLMAFAKNKGCSRITAFSNNRKLISLLNKFNADTETRFISWEVY